MKRMNILTALVADTLLSRTMVTQIISMMGISITRMMATSMTMSSLFRITIRILVRPHIPVQAINPSMCIPKSAMPAQIGP